MFASVLPLLSSRLTQAALALLALLAVYLWGDGWRDKAHRLMSENAILRIDLDAVKLANTEATKRAQAEKLAQEKLDAKRKELSDAKLAQARRDARALADRYARRMRTPAPESGSGCTNLSAPSSTTGGVDGPCPDAEYVAVTREDFDIMADNSIRLREAHEWAVGR